MCDYHFKYGDVLWCNREFAEEIEEKEHKEGPFIFLKGEKDFFYAIKGTSNYLPNKTKNSYYDIVLDNTNSNLRKKTEFQTNIVTKVPYTHVISHIDSLDEDNKDFLLKSFYIRTHKGYPIGMDLNIIKRNINYAPGDVLEKDDEKYMIVKVSEGNFHLCKLYDDELNNTHMNIKKVLVTDNLEGFVLNSLISGCKKYEYMFRYFADINYDPTSKIRYGSILQYYDHLLYVATVDKNKYLCYKLRFATLDDHDLIIRGEPLKIDFEMKELDINNKKYNIIFNLDDETINLIRELKKQDKRCSKNKKTPQKEYDYDISFFFGRILRLKGNQNKHLALYSVHNHKCLCVDLDLLKCGRFELLRYYQNQIDFSSCPRNEFIDFINNINVEIKDEQYLDFLTRSGVYNYDKYAKGVVRKRTNKRNK